MSGSGGGGYSPPDTNCANLSFTTVLSSPQVSVISTLKKGDQLKLELQLAPVKLVMATNKGKFTGTITTQAQKLIACIEAGTDYVADVVSVSGHQCSVEVHAS